VVTTSDRVLLISPVAPRVAAPPALGPSSGAIAVGIDVAGLRVSVVENSKPNAVELLTFVQRGLIAEHGARPGTVIHKPISGAITAEALAALVESSDLVLVGSAD
jgi:hypothetical protein